MIPLSRFLIVSSWLASSRSPSFDPSLADSAESALFLSGFSEGADCSCFFSDSFAAFSFSFFASSASIASTRSAFFIVEVLLIPLDFAKSRKTVADKLSYFSLIQ